MTPSYVPNIVFYILLLGNVYILLQLTLLFCRVLFSIRTDGDLTNPRLHYQKADLFKFLPSKDPYFIICTSLTIFII